MNQTRRRQLPKERARHEQGLRTATIVTTARMVDVPLTYVERLVVDDLRARNYAPLHGGPTPTPTVTWTRNSEGEVVGCRVEFQHVVEHEE